MESILKKIYGKQAQISVYFCASCLKASSGKLLETEGSVEGGTKWVKDWLPCSHIVNTAVPTDGERYPKRGRYLSSWKKSEKDYDVLIHHLFSSQKNYQPFLWHFEKIHNTVRQLNILKSARSYMIAFQRYILYSCLKFDTNKICYKFVVLPFLSFPCLKLPKS